MIKFINFDSLWLLSLNLKYLGEDLCYLWGGACHMLVLMDKDSKKLNIKSGVVSFVNET